ncbi:transposase [Trichonephila clavipes]|nr:transposase [Trichonephila clavipes]
MPIGTLRCQVIYSQFGLTIHQNDHQARRGFVEWAQNEIAVVPDFHKRILFSVEAHFWLNGYVNKQNCRIWSEANPQVYVETPLHPEKLTVWCALWSGGIIGPYFFKNDEGHNVTVNGDRYRAMITNFFIPELNNNDVQELWFQQDGATCHTARATIDLLKDTFGDRLISRFGPVNWPPRPCDLTPLDYFLWGYVKSLVYADKPQTLDHLEDNIRRVIADIRPQMLEKVIENWTSRLDYIRASRGSHMPEIIFKMQISLEVDNDDVQELLDFHNKELKIDEFIEMHEQEQNIEELESIDSVQSKDRMTISNLTEGLSLIEKGLQILENMFSNEESIFSIKQETATKKALACYVDILQNPSRLHTVDNPARLSERHFISHIPPTLTKHESTRHCKVCRSIKDTKGKKTRKETRF